MLATGLSKSRLAQIIGDAEPFGEEAAEGLAGKLTLPLTWFSQTLPTIKEANKLGVALADVAVQIQEPVTNRTTSVVSDERPQEVAIPQYAVGGSMGKGLVLQGDQPGMIRNMVVTKEWAQKNLRSNTGLQNLCIVTGFGDSMKPLFNPGDPLIVDQGVKACEVDAVYFFRVGDEGFIKRLQRVPGEGVWALSANKEYKDWLIQKGADFEVFGRVLKAWKGEDL